jgi:uncharacterized membrane protein HdeD (DUF308 family)
MNSKDMNQANGKRGNTLWGTFQIIIGAFLIGQGLSKQHVYWFDLIPVAIGVLSIINGVLRFMGKVKGRTPQAWQFALFIGLTLVVMFIALLSKP